MGLNNGQNINKEAIPVAQTKRISDMPASIVSTIKKALSGMECGEEKIFAIEGAGGTSACYLVAKDQAGRMYSMMLSREKELDSAIILG